MSGLLDEARLEAWGIGVGAASSAAAAPGASAAAAPSAPSSRLPLVLALRGPLGAGKSVLARAVARGAGVRGPMPSPTYNLRYTYAGDAGVRVHHLDLYRLEDPDDVWELGWEELAAGPEVVLIEWPERVEALLPPDRWDAVLEFTDDPAVRRLRLARCGAPPPLPPLPAGEAAS